MKVLVSDGIEKVGSDLLKAAGVEVVEKKLSPDELLKDICNYEAIIVRSATKVTKEVIDAGTKLKAIGRGGVGIDNIDSAYAATKGIPVLNTPGASSISVAELAIAHMFAVVRFLNTSSMQMRKGEWPKKEYAAGLELTGKTLGVLGFGNIGRETAKRALGLGMKIVAFDPFVNTTDMDVKLCTKDEVLAQSDFITLHLPLIKGEPVPVGTPEFAKMKDGVIIINCARGGVVDEVALLNALNSGKVLGAGIDVWTNEPATDAQVGLINHPRVSATPHIGASTNEAQDRIGIEIAEKILDAIKK
ncbi:MAG: D-2-hydroxyacid dehydrogenase [Ignavibacteria bacterium]|jgi:D-3-phosphoglycerate dehydrogenase|nr:D-2-hydroxyacid dehydrogenase [Ignavibacteria bacterium]